MDLLGEFWIDFSQTSNRIKPTYLIIKKNNHAVKIYHHPDHLLHHPKNEFEGKRIRSYPETPDRVTNIIHEIKSEGLEHLVEIPPNHGKTPIEKVHERKYVSFLAESAKFLKKNDIDEICPTIFSPTLPQHIKNSFFAKLGHYIFDPATPLTPGTYQAAISSVDVAISAVKRLDYSNQNFALNRPPGHHANANSGGGYCLFNNMAIATQYLVDHGKSVSILDLDYHHGNGTQDIFYRTDEVQYVSIHSDPVTSYPYYWGSSKEIGEDEGKGFNHNFPVSALCDEKQYEITLMKALSVINEYSPDTVLVSMGFDCHQDDPIAGMRLSTDFYSEIGKQLGKFDKLAVILEGGYALDAIGPAFMKLFLGITAS